MKRRIVQSILIMLLILPVTLLGLMNTASGSRWLLQTLLSSLPAQASVKHIEGRILDRLKLYDVHYQSNSENLTIKQLVFAWQPANLFAGTLNIVDITLNGLTLTLADTPPPAEETPPFDSNAAIQLPLQITIDNLLITDVIFQQGEQIHEVQKLQLSAFTKQDQLTLTSLVIDAKPAQTTATGQIGLGNGFPLALKATWQIDTKDYGVFQANTQIKGDLQQLNFNNQLASPFNLDLNGRLADLQTTPRITARGDWKKLTWPLVSNKPDMSSEQGSFELDGLLDQYQLTLAGALTQPYLPKAQLTFKGKGSMEAIEIEKLAITSTAGAFQLGGNVSWKDNTVFDFTANGQDFNPAILSSEFPGSLTFNTHIKGQTGKPLTVDASITKLTGKLRGQPVSAKGQLALVGDRLAIEALHIASGENILDINGALGEKQTVLDFNLNAPVLKTLWPTLGGSLNGKGHLQGSLKNPSVTLQASGKQLHLAEQSAQQLTITVDYHADTQTTSTLDLSALGIESEGIHIPTLSIKGTGTLPQHHFSTDLRSSYGDVSSLLKGSFNKGVWQGVFSKLDLNTPDFGSWALKDPLAVRVAQTRTGNEITLAKTCFTQHSAELCTQAHYPASGDLELQMEATNLPTQLLQAYLPKQMTITGLINAAADIQQKKGLLSGNYQLGLPNKTTVLFEDQLKPIEFTLGPASLSGHLKDKLVSTDFNLDLVGQDYLRGQLHLDTGKSKALSGQVTASVINLGLLKPFIPKASALEGHVKADVNVQGTTEKPLFKGMITFKQGVIDLAESGFGLRKIDLQAQASGGHDNHIQLQGSAKPIIINSNDTPDQLAYNGILKVTADIHEKENLLSGHYRIEAPANASISVKTKEASTKTILGPSSLAGDITDTTISANLILGLAAQDAVRAQLQVNTDKTKALSGKIKASIVELNLINPFIPQAANIKGNVDADLALAGSTEQPILTGALNLTKGAVDLTELGLNLTQIKFKALASTEHTERLQINGSAKSGQGDINLNGFINLNGSSELALQGTNFEVAKLPEAQIAISPDLKLLFSGNQGKVTGQLKIPKALLTLKELPENAIAVSPDEVILGEEIPEKKAAVATNIDADIEVELGKQIHFSGQGLESDLSGKLKITKTREKMVMHGNVDMKKARYKSYGQDLTVRKGRFLFNGPVDKPWLDVEAIRISKSKEVTAILSLSGPLAAPKTRITSEPALPEADALAYLVTGNALSQVSKSEGNMVASAALSYGAGQVSWIADKLGVDEFEVKEGKTLQDTLVAVGQYLTPDFYVGTRVGLFNQQAVLVLKHKLTDSLNVETQAGTSQRIKLNYDFEDN